MHFLVNRTEWEDCRTWTAGCLHTSWAVQLQRHDWILSLLRKFDHLRPKRNKQPSGPTKYDIARDCGEGL